VTRECLVWIMRFQHARFRAGRNAGIARVSHLKFRDAGKVFQHHDYFDMGAFITSRVPVLAASSAPSRTACD